MNWFKKISKKSRIKGGIADDRPDSSFNQKELNDGIIIELEHTNDKDLSKDIAKDHLEEFPTYYTELKKMEDKLENKEAGRGLYNQQQGDSYNQQAGDELIKDWEVANREELKIMKAMAQQHRFNDMKEYGQKLIEQGFDRLLVEKIMTAAMFKVKL